MFNVIAKARSVVAIDLSDDLLTKAVVLSTDGERYSLESWEYYSEQSSGNADFLQSYKPEAVIVVMGDAHTLCFAVPELDGLNLEMEKRKRGLTVETQFSDYLNVSRSGMLAAIRRDTAEEILKSVKDTFPGIPQMVISQSMVALLYTYLRSYRPQPEIRVGILHCAGQMISLLVAQTEMPVWQGSIDLKAETRENVYSEISALLQTANEKIGGTTRYDLLLLAGDCDAEDVKAMRNFAQQVELFTPYRNNAFEFGRLSSTRRREAQLDGHRLAVAIGGAGMFLERVGVNLSDTDIELTREIPLDRVVRREQTIANTVVNGFGTASRKFLPLLLEQSKLLVLSVIIAISLFSYRYYTFSQIQTKIQTDINKEQIRANSLKDIQIRHDEYKRKIAAIDERTAAIGEIRKNQLTVKTILSELDQRAPKGLVLGDVDIQETNIKIKGYASERAAVFTFANRLGQSLGIFADVVPVFDDHDTTGKYEISCRYIGPIPINDTTDTGSTRASIKE